MLQLLKKLKLNIKLGYKYSYFMFSHTNLSAIFCRLPAIHKSIFTSVTSYWTTASSVKSISRVNLSENVPGSIKCRYFDTVISPSLKICQ